MDTTSVRMSTSFSQKMITLILGSSFANQFMSFTLCGRVFVKNCRLLMDGSSLVFWTSWLACLLLKYWVKRLIGKKNKKWREKLLSNTNNFFRSFLIVGIVVTRSLSDKKHSWHLLRRLLGSSLRVESFRKLCLNRLVKYSKIVQKANELMHGRLQGPRGLERPHQCLRDNKLVWQMMKLIILI
jgi:hypothetical protein